MAQTWHTYRDVVDVDVLVQINVLGIDGHVAAVIIADSWQQWTLPGAFAIRWIGMVCLDVVLQLWTVGKEGTKIGSVGDQFG